MLIGPIDHIYDFTITIINFKGKYFGRKRPPQRGNKIDPQIFEEENRPYFRVILLKQGRKGKNIYVNRKRKDFFLFYV